MKVMKNKLAGRDRGKIVRSLLGYFVKEENAGQNAPASPVGPARPENGANRAAARLDAPRRILL